ncbi:Tyrosinase ustQ [Dictyocoela muelleri]|nr:Tyrosinase ustQ [Dictyocoela muelleri]
MKKYKSYRIRRDIRSLSSEELEDFNYGLERLRKEGIIDELAVLHENVKDYAHNTHRFLAWHRMFLIYFENLLRIFTKNKEITVPYWDWTSHKYDDYFKIDCFEVNYPNTHCVKRSESPDNNYNKQQINRLLKRNKEFESILELVPHALVHLNIGGKDGDMSQMYSTNDPIFWVHHSMIDYIWDLKQNNMLLGDNYEIDEKFVKFNKKNQKKKKLKKKRQKKLKEKYLFYDGDMNEILFPFNMKVKDVLDNETCQVKYIPYNPINTQMIEIVPRLSDKYIKRHGYDLRKTRYYEKIMNNEDTIWDRIKLWLLS